MMNRTFQLIDIAVHMCSNKMNEIIYRIHLYLLNAFGPNQNSSFILSL